MSFTIGGLAMAVHSVRLVLSFSHHHNGGVRALGGLHRLGKSTLIRARDIAAAHVDDLGLG